MCYLCGGILFVSALCTLAKPFSSILWHLFMRYYECPSINNWLYIYVLVFIYIITFIFNIHIINVCVTGQPSSLQLGNTLFCLEFHFISVNNHVPFPTLWCTKLPLEVWFKIAQYWSPFLIQNKCFYSESNEGSAHWASLTLDLEGSKIVAWPHKLCLWATSNSPCSFCSSSPLKPCFCELTLSYEYLTP